MAWLTYRWHRRLQPHEIDPDYLSELPLLTATLVRFNHKYQGEFKVPLQATTLAFLLEDDLAHVFERLPDWLSCVCAGVDPAELLFGTQGTELALSAERTGNSVRVSARSFDPSRPLPGGPLVVPLREFVADWSQFLLTLLEALANLEPRLRTDHTWQQYRDTILAACSHNNASPGG
jgi:hypothetical protein